MDIEQAFKAFFESLGLDIHIMYENEQYDAPIGKAWARFEVGGTITARESQGVCGTNLTEGEATLEIMAPTLNGRDIAASLANEILNAVDTAPLNTLQFTAPASKGASYREATTWYVLPVDVPYQFSNKRGG